MTSKNEWSDDKNLLMKENETFLKIYNKYDENTLKLDFAQNYFQNIYEKEDGTAIQIDQNDFMNNPIVIP